MKFLKFKAFSLSKLNLKAALLFFSFFSSLNFFSSNAQALSFIDKARVVNVVPVFEEHNRVKCYELEERKNGDSLAGTIFGGIAGGLIGNQIGKGHGREAATAIGAVTGSVIGNNISKDSERPRNRCVRTVVADSVSHYQIVYEYKGRRATMVSKYEPEGLYVDVQVDVTPL